MVYHAALTAQHAPSLPGPGETGDNRLATLPMPRPLFQTTSCLQTGVPAFEGTRNLLVTATFCLFRSCECRLSFADLSCRHGADGAQELNRVTEQDGGRWLVAGFPRPYGRLES